MLIFFYQLCNVPKITNCEYYGKHSAIFNQALANRKLLPVARHSGLRIKCVTRTRNKGKNLTELDLCLYTLQVREILSPLMMYFCYLFDVIFSN
jgi:hypothetical protein